MDLATLQTFAREKLVAYGLAADGWRFAFDGAKRRFGSCRYRTKTITVSRHLAALNGEEECRDTVLHEIAHALAGRAAGHGPAWKAACRRVGARPIRCYASEEVVQPPARYWGVCPRCQKKIPYYRRPRTARACAACCQRHSGGRYDERFRLRIYEVQATSERAGTT